MGNTAADSGAAGHSGKGVFSHFGKLDIKKKIQYLAILLIIIVILTIYFASGAIGSQKEESDTPTVTQETQGTVSADSIEQKLKYTLSRIEGAGNVEVMITYESTGEIVPAISVDKQTSTTKDDSDNGTSTTNTENTQSEVVTVGGSSGNSALVLKEISPKVRGVIVIAEGADDIMVKLNLLSAVETLLNISPDQVDVYKMNH